MLVPRMFQHARLALGLLPAQHLTLKAEHFMTREEILQRVARDGICIISWREFHEIFQGHCLTKDEMDFKIEFAKAGGEKPYNPTGSSQHDKLMRFLDENHLSYRWINEQPAFYRGRVDFSAYDAKHMQKKDSPGPDSSEGFPSNGR